MSFFDQVPLPPVEPESPQPPRPKWLKPETELGGVVAAEMVLGASDRAVVGVGGITAYANGFELNLVAVLRREDRRGRLFHLGFHREAADEPPVPEFLRLGVRFADGGVATNLGGDHFGREGEPAGPLLSRDGGGGGGRRYEMRYWIWPLPPPGPVTVVCEWPAHGIGECHAELDGQAIRDAAARAVIPWPDQS